MIGVDLEHSLKIFMGTWRQAPWDLNWERKFLGVLKSAFLNIYVNKNKLDTELEIEPQVILYGNSRRILTQYILKMDRTLSIEQNWEQFALVLAG